jgi:hypothetical protein
MPPTGFEPAFPKSERPQAHALYGAATGIGQTRSYGLLFLTMTDNITSQHVDHSSWITLYMTSIIKDRLRLVTLCNVIITKPEFLILFARGGL